MQLRGPLLRHPTGAGECPGAIQERISGAASFKSSSRGPSGATQAPRQGAAAVTRRGSLGAATGQDAHLNRCGSPAPSHRAHVHVQPALTLDWLCPGRPGFNVTGGRGSQRARRTCRPDVLWHCTACFASIACGKLCRRPRKTTGLHTPKRTPRLHMRAKRAGAAPGKGFSGHCCGLVSTVKYGCV